MNPQNTPFKEAPFVHTLTDEAWRDWYAGQALAGYLAGHPHIKPCYDEVVARGCFELADAMMAERAERRMK